MSKIWAIFFIFIIFVLSAPIQSSVFKVVSRSVVEIMANDSQNVTTCHGSGFFIDRAGDVITNLHVINGSSNVNIRTSDGRTYQVKNVLAKDISSDLVCLSVNIPSQLIFPIELNTNLPEVEDNITVIGYVEGLEKFVETSNIGRISSVEPTDEFGEVLRIDVSISPGNSGSPVLNMRGEVIGVATQGLLRGQKANFAVSSKQVDKLIHGISSPQGGKPISEWNLTSEEEHYAIGIDLYRKGEYNQSIYYLEDAIKLDPNHAETWATKGAALYGLKKYDEAIKACDEAIRLDPNYAEAWNNKAAALNGLKKYDEAVKACDETIRLDPNHAEAWNNKATALDGLTKYDEAIKACDEAIRLNPNLAEAWYTKAVTLYGLTKYDEAIKACDEAIRLNPNYAEAWATKGAALDSLTKYDEAIKAYDEAIRLDPNLAVAWNNKGVALMALGRSAEADAAFAKAKELGYTG